LVNECISYMLLYLNSYCGSLNASESIVSWCLLPMMSDEYWLKWHRR
jgi:hypothetical protein